MNWNELDISISGLKRHYLNADFSPRELVEHLLNRCKEYECKNIWIKRLNLEEIEPYLDFLEKNAEETLPLFGIPFAIKDNIDLKDIPTTAACEAFTYKPDRHAFVVEQLIDAGAIPIGKTNMDQFATGLVGTRSPEPWGPCKNAFDDDYISGGSSSGSAVSVALGLVSFSLGTDTAGSGRIPAAFNNVVGLKATKGLLSTSGVVPACRSLDVVSIFSLTADDANVVFDIACQFDINDPYARKNHFLNSKRVSGVGKGQLILGIPQHSQLQFFNDCKNEETFFSAVEKWKELGAEIREIDFSSFLQAAKLLYEGPWVTERYIATKELLKNNPLAIHPVVRKIVEGGCENTAEDTFNSQYKLQALKKVTDKIMEAIDLIITPTAGTSYTIDQLLEDPINLNSNLGYYTNYMNLLDYSAVALPFTNKAENVPNGFTLVAKAHEDQKLLAWARTWQYKYQSELGKTQIRIKEYTKNTFSNQEFTNVVVCGAHLTGQALNWQLTERNACLIKKTKSSNNYRLYALADGKRPGMVRDEESGCAIDIEVWRMPTENFGSFVAAIPAPLGIGKVQLSDTSWESGFICDAYGLEGATDISHMGGWIAYIKQAEEK